MTSADPFAPDWASAPGDTASDLLRERGLSTTDLADLLGLEHADTKDLLTGDAHVTAPLARGLSRHLGASESFWMVRESQYRAELTRLRQADQDWLNKLPLRDMRKFGWLAPASGHDATLAACQQFFGISRVREWHHKYAALMEMTAFRRSSAYHTESASVAAWLRQGEIEAERTDCRPWNPERFELELATIRALTREKDPSRFLSPLQAICAESGVAVVIVRTPAKCVASGATWFASPDRAILQLSFRYLTDDHFWFSFFHEAGHLLLHSARLTPSDRAQNRKRWILEDVGNADDEVCEDEANAFASRTLVPSEFERLLGDVPLRSRDLIKLAREIGVSPGIVVGQLQHCGRLTNRQMNRLKRRFEWGGAASIRRRIF